MLDNILQYSTNDKTFPTRFNLGYKGRLCPSIILKVSDCIEYHVVGSYFHPSNHSQKKIIQDIGLLLEICLLKYNTIEEKKPCKNTALSYKYFLFFFVEI